MDNYRGKIANGEEVSHHTFEQHMSAIVPNGGYHFAESITLAFWQNNRWEEVFDTLYRNMHKYLHIKKGDIY